MDPMTFINHQLMRQLRRTIGTRLTGAPPERD